MVKMDARKLVPRKADGTAFDPPESNKGAMTIC